MCFKIFRIQFLHDLASLTSVLAATRMTSHTIVCIFTWTHAGAYSSLSSVAELKGSEGSFQRSIQSDLLLISESILLLGPAPTCEVPQVGERSVNYYQ